jgi:chromosome partitioning protein
VKTVAFFNNKGGVGKTTLVYHLAWMYQELGIDVVTLDLDPQANLTAAFLEEEKLEQLWLDQETAGTILGVIQPLQERLGDLRPPELQVLGDHLALLPGNLGLSRFEDQLADAWLRCLQDDPAEAHNAFRLMSAFYRAALLAAEDRGAELMLIDVSPSLGALNRAALIACDFVVMPLSTDLDSLQGLRNLGSTLSQWRSGWEERLQANAPPALPLPSGSMQPLGYIVLQHAVRVHPHMRAHFFRWLERIPRVYHQSILGESEETPIPVPDPHQLATLKHYRSLMPLAQDAHKPMFLLKPADGAIGGHTEAVLDCYRDFKALALRIAKASGVETKNLSRA